jgi:anaphase-promoting complex subunit 4
LPALERFTVLVSRLRGLSKFQDSNAGFGLSTQDLDNILDTTSCLQLMAHHILITAASELRQFSAFSLWLRHEIEVQSVDTQASAAYEASERDNNIDHGSTLQYIQGAMHHSRLYTLFNIAELKEQKPQWSLVAEGRPLYEMYRRELDNLFQSNISDRHLPGLDALIIYLDSQCNAVFATIAETQKRNVRFGPPVYLGIGVPHSVDMRLLPEVP